MPLRRILVRATGLTNLGLALMMLCGKCKTMLAVIEKPKVAEGFVALPIINAAI